MRRVFMRRFFSFKGWLRQFVQSIVSNTQSLHCINSYPYVYVSLLVENMLKSAGDLVHVKIVFCCCILSDWGTLAHVCLKLTRGKPPQSNYASCGIFQSVPANTEKDSSLIKLHINTCFVGFFVCCFLFFFSNQVSLQQPSLGFSYVLFLRAGCLL